MSEKDRTSSSSSADSSPSEGEYMIQDGDSEAQPKFDFSCWNPEAPAGLQFLSLLPINQGYEITYDQQDEHIGKIKVSTTHRRTRRKDFSSGRTIGKHIIDEKKLRQAVDGNDKAAVMELLDSGVDPSGTDEKKRTALHFAAAKGHDEMIGLLLDYGADPNQKDVIGNTPLHLAACTSHIHVITLLLKAGTDINSIDNMGHTPLHLARSRLRLLHDNKSYTSDQLKLEVAQIVGMMKEYLSRAGHTDGMSQLDALCDQLAGTSTREEVDAVSELLSDFTNLTLQKKQEQPG